MKLLNLPDAYPTVIRRLQPAPPNWEEMTTEPIAAARSMVEWLQDKSFSLPNVHNYATFHHHNHLHHSVCGLTVANAKAIGRLLVSRRKFDEEARNGSDHVVIRYTTANKRVATRETTRERPNWKNANEETYNESFRAVPGARKDKLSGVVNQVQPIGEAIEDAIWKARHNAMKRTAPAAAISRHSVPYWDEELSGLHNERIRAKRDADGPE